ncbi:helix-turn-helix transcriptional regulator [Vagococcus sp. PNs007]|uniref:Helix-turn-helix transcriptional regulator n=1 Tax=Vagococcus proximus TaxID=2991417 RepID=A0ABT5X2N4_9ENTE|nr:helix-turn-helix transcriptional regulator [Vagococcus proximus]MDF0480240.1 helix-turn-helix transcriptional regulator [Vagococcus proximus]
MSNKLGEYLRELRGKQSLRDISEKTQLRLSHSYISDLENGYSRKKKPIQPSPETLKILSEVYNVKYYELMELAGYLEPQDTQNISHSTNSIEQELNKMIRDLTHGDAQSINDMDENTKELLIMSLENSLRIAQRESKKK